MSQATLKPDNKLVFVWRVIACHMTSYFVMGWLASSALDYRSLFGTEHAQPSGAWQYMRGFDSPWIAAGPMLQCIRGTLFGLVLWPLRELWISERRGFWQVWLLILGLAILGPTAAAPGSLEGLIYTNLSLSSHLLGLPEMLTQTVLFSWLVQRWYRHPSRAFDVLMIAAVVVVCVLSTLGVLAALYPEAFTR